LIVAAITGGAGIVQGLVQGALTSRSASVSARQEAARAAIELCDRLSEHVADAGQAANEYGLELTEKFLKDWAAREPLVRRIHVADARVFAAVAALPADSAARVPVEAGMKVIMNLVSLGDASDLNAAWVRDRHLIARALEAIGRERAFQYRRLEAAARMPWARWAVGRTKPAVEG
jgi:hypothetical protein